MALAGNGRLAFLALSGLHDLAATLSGPATLLLVAELHERSFGEPPPSSIFAAGLTVQGVAAIAVSPVLCARLDGVGRRVGLICCALADAAVYFALFCVGFGSSTSYWPVLAAQALAGCNSGCKRASLEIYKYDVAQGSVDAAASLTSNRMTVEAVSCIAVAAVLSVGELEPVVAVGLALLLEAAFLCVAVALVSEPQQSTTANPTATTAASAGGLTGWGALVAVWNIPLERVHLLGALICIGAAPNLQRKMQFGERTQGTAANLATMTSLGKITYIAVAVFDLMPKAKRWLGVRPILVWESLGHSLACLMCIGDDVTVRWIYFADVIKWGSLAVGDPVEESYRGVRVQRAGIGIGSWEASKKVVNNIAGLYVPALQVALWSVHLDMPLLWAGGQFLAAAAGIYWAVGLQESQEAEAEAELEGKGKGTLRQEEEEEEEEEERRGGVPSVATLDKTKTA